MTKAQFVDAIRGYNLRDEDPNLERVVPDTNIAQVFCACMHIVSIIAMVVSLCFIGIGVCIQQWEWLWFLALHAASVVCMGITRDIVGAPKYKHKSLDIEEIRTYRGKHIYIHWLNNVTGYADEWVPFYGNTEEFVRYDNGRPEICVAPFEQYGRGWIAYATQISSEILRKECMNEHT